MIRFSYDSFRRQRLYDPMLRLVVNLLKLVEKKAFFMRRLIF